jgi:hypothetical protein
MAILNQTNDGMFHVLIILARCLVSTGPIKKEKLLALCAPESLTDQKMARQTLRRWTQIGLFSEADDVVRFNDELPIKLTKRSLSNDEIARAVRHLIFRPKNNERFWEAEGNMSADMCRITAWILAQDVHSLRPTNFQAPEELYLSQLETGDAIFQNDTRWNGFKSWCRFLGFGATESGKSKGELIIDPTRAIRRIVRDLLPPKDEIPVDEFLQQLADQVPVLDRGVYRVEVESRLRRKKWKEPGEAEISTSLSRALLRLRSQGILRLEKRSDSDSQVRLIGRGGIAVQSVTHVKRGDAK